MAHKVGLGATTLRRVQAQYDGSKELALPAFDEETCSVRARHGGEPRNMAVLEDVIYTVIRR